MLHFYSLFFIVDTYIFYYITQLLVLIFLYDIPNAAQRMAGCIANL